MRSAAEFDPDYGDAVAADQARLAAIRDALAELDAATDPKLAALVELLESSPAQKIAVFSTFGASIRYLDEHLPDRVGGRERVTVIGSESTPDQRLAALGRFAPRTVVAPDYEPPDGEVDLLLSTDVLSEGQNLQQAQEVVSYDMPWNPQRVVQRTVQEQIGPKQRWALELLRDPEVALPPGADLADDVLAVERSSAVRRALSEVGPIARGRDLAGSGCR
ncbi:MAG: C-terminal helicase domain-containing protein [Solirubrobacteraceae bacterium]